MSNYQDTFQQPAQQPVWGYGSGVVQTPYFSPPPGRAGTPPPPPLPPPPAYSLEDPLSASSDPALSSSSPVLSDLSDPARSDAPPLPPRPATRPSLLTAHSSHSFPPPPRSPNRPPALPPRPSPSYHEKGSPYESTPPAGSAPMHASTWPRTSSPAACSDDERPPPMPPRPVGYGQPDGDHKAPIEKGASGGQASSSVSTAPEYPSTSQDGYFDVPPPPPPPPPPPMRQGKAPDSSHSPST